MNIWTRIRSLLRGVTRRKDVERAMHDEIRFHIETYADDLVGQGIAPDEALRRARIEFGSIEAQKEECRASLGLRLWDELRADLRYSFRALRNSPGFTVVAILTLALGIGANTAIFTLVDAVMLRLLPIQRAEELFQVKQTRPSDPAPASIFTNVMWEALRDRQDVFSSAAAWGNADFNLARGGAAQKVDGLWVSGDFFAMVAVPPAAGRLVSPADDRRGCPAIAVLSYNFWQERYAGSPAAVGSTISLDSHPFEIVGVSARGFSGLTVGNKFDVAAPICATAVLDPGRSPLEHRSWWWLNVAGRIKPGISPQHLNARLAAISPQAFAASLPPNRSEESKQNFLQRQYVAVPAGSGVSYLRSDFERPLTVLMAVVGMVLLIACANVAALMLSRAASQSREIAVRLALGATRARIVRQLLTYCVLLSLAGAAAGGLLAYWGTAVLVRTLSTRNNQVFLDLLPDGRILAFTAGIALLTGILFGILPAYRSSRVPLTAAMRSVPGLHGEGRHSLRKWIVGAQVALSLVLLITAGLFLRSFAKLVWLNPGFDRQNVLLVNVDLRKTTIPTDQHAATFDAIQSRLGALPGVMSVGRSHLTPLSGMVWNDVVRPDTGTQLAGNDAISFMNFISPGYLSTMRTPLLAGRDFTDADGKNAAKVVIVNQTFARKFFPSVDPVGHVIRIDTAKGEPGDPIQIVGVVADAKYSSLREAILPTSFFPLAQIPDAAFQETFALRIATPASSLLHPVQATFAEINRDIPLEFTTLAQQVDDTLVRERLLAMLSAFFGSIALLLAMIGLYGTVSYRVTLRRAEFGIRMALGARYDSIIRLVIREVAVIVLVGVAAGLAISVVATTALQKLLFNLGPRDVTTLAGASVLLALVALFAAYAPARRAARVDPMIALRCE